MILRVRTKTNVKIPTKNNRGIENGFLVPIINIHDCFVEIEQWPKQVYLTVANPGEVKGPHLHKKRWGLFTCIKGNVKIVIKVDGNYEEYYSGEDFDFNTIQVPPQHPAAIVNICREDAYVLNMPSPSWSAEDPDEWSVEFEGYNCFE
jgi:dTDP-4-dehydrorhamnose 3,5-epimerase